jgi:hypothetical protein
VSYQTGTVTNINDLLDTFKTFLVGAGWTVHSWWREKMMMGVFTGGIPLHDEYSYRFGVRLSVSKGTKHVLMQDFYITHDFLYGTNGGTFPKNGPGIAVIMGAAAAATDFVDGAIHGGVALFPTFTTPATVPETNIMVCPLPSVTHQDSGTWDPSDVNHPLGIDDGTLAAPFGPVGGAPVPMPYWMFADATGDNVVLVVLHDNTTTLRTTYICFGDLLKAGNWNGGTYLGASHATVNAFTGLDGPGHAVNRFGPPGAIADDGGITFSVRITDPVDSTLAGWFGLGGGGRRIISSAEMDIQGVGPTGLRTGSFGFGILRTLRSSVVDGAPGLPVYLAIQRDSGLLSLIGTLPNIYQAKSAGFVPGTDTLAQNGDAVVVFDGFSVKKVP